MIPAKRLRPDLEVKLDISDHDSKLSQSSVPVVGVELAEAKRVAALRYQMTSMTL